MQDWFNEYVAADKAEKESKAIKEKHKIKVRKLLRRCKRLGIVIPGASYIEKSKFDISEDLMLNFLRENYPQDVLDNLTKNVLDWEKLQDAILVGQISLEDLPKNTWREIIIPTVTIKG